MSKLTKDIAEFHRKFGLEYKGRPRVLPEDLAAFRTLFIGEEFEEYRLATQAATDAIKNGKLSNLPAAMEKQLDAIVDLVYVVLGTAHLHGYDFDAAWKRVHTANMQKVRARKKSDSKRGSAKYDVVKPKDWQAPVLLDLVKG